MTANTQNEEHQLLSVRQVARLLGIGQTKTYELLREGLPVVRLGRTVRISSETLQHWIKQQEHPYRPSRRSEARRDL